MGFLSPDSHCYSFDDRANGYSRGEGCGVIVLKRVSAAIRDGDTIRAVIRSTGSNQDGRTPGITQPNELSQSALIKETYEKAGLDFNTTRYFEAHGKFPATELHYYTYGYRNGYSNRRSHRSESYWQRFPSVPEFKRSSIHVRNLRIIQYDSCVLTVPVLAAQSNRI